LEDGEPALGLLPELQGLTYCGSDGPFTSFIDARQNAGRLVTVRRIPSPLKCPVCQRHFNRVQEQNRHLESYLPHSILCPFLDCAWTGRRQSHFKEHWERSHPGTKAPSQVENKIYDPRDFVKAIIDGTPVDEVARSAFAKAQETLGRLGKAGADVLGRNRDLREWVHIPS
jgi:hypothetical protein